ncbi:hypothetical protein D3C77_357790 [compost metagenome]
MIDCRIRHITSLADPERLAIGFPSELDVFREGRVVKIVIILAIRNIQGLISMPPIILAVAGHRAHCRMTIWIMVSEKGMNTRQQLIRLGGIS